MAVALTVGLASVLWFVTFYLSGSTFWIKISFSAATLAILSLWLQPNRADQFRFNKSAIVIGFVSAGLLYFIFFLGKGIASAALPFAQGRSALFTEKGREPQQRLSPFYFFLSPDPARKFIGAAICKKTS